MINLTQDTVEEPMNRLEAVARGLAVETMTHENVHKETPVVETKNFDFWYGVKQALFDINMN